MLRLLALLLALLRPPARAQEPAAQDVSLGVVSTESPAPGMSWRAGRGQQVPDSQVRLEPDSNVQRVMGVGSGNPDFCVCQILGVGI